MRLTDERLSPLKMFYIRYPKPDMVHFEHKTYDCETGETASSLNGPDKVLAVDKPELRKIVEENIARLVDQGQCKCVGCH